MSRRRMHSHYHTHKIQQGGMLRRSVSEATAASVTFLDSFTKNNLHYCYFFQNKLPSNSLNALFVSVTSLGKGLPEETKTLGFCCCLAGDTGWWDVWLWWIQLWWLEVLWYSSIQSGALGGLLDRCMPFCVMKGSVRPWQTLSTRVQGLLHSSINTVLAYSKNKNWKKCLSF